MALSRAKKEDTQERFAQIMQAVAERHFSPLYVLCGEEPFYSDLIIKRLSETVLKPEQKDFNFSIIYGSDYDAGEIICLCRRYPIDSDYQLIIVKEAQLISSLQPFERYLDSPPGDTVLVLSFTGANLDRRTGFYKKAKEKATLLEASSPEEWRLPAWITDYVKGLGYEIEPAAAQLLGYSTGNSLRKIALEIDKLIKGSDSKLITVNDVELGVGVSRDFNAFELCKAAGERNFLKCFSIADVFGNNPKKYPLQMTLGALFYYFNQLLKIEAVISYERVPFFQAAQRLGLFGTREKELEGVARNFPLPKTMRALSLIRDCDYKSKSNAGGSADDGALLKELLSKMLI